MCAQITGTPNPTPVGFSKQTTVTAVVLAAVLGVVGGYALHHNTKTGVQNQNKTVGTLNIKEFGVQVPLSQMLKDTTYTVLAPPPHVKTSNIVQLHLTAYTTIVNQCLSNYKGPTPSYAVLFKGSGTVPIGMTVLKQFSNYYIANTGSTLSKGTVCQKTAGQQALNDFNNNIDSALSTAFSSAQQVN